MDLTKIFRAAILAAAATFSVSAQAADITGAGATFPYPIYSKWADAYKTATGMGLNYQSIGSGAGIKQIQAKTVTFGATDALKFFTWAYDNGGKMAEDLDYIPMPASVVKMVKDSWAKDIQSK